VYDGLELPEDAWRDENEERSPASETSNRHVNGLAWYWWCVGVALLLFFGLGVLALL
jgi:hypothetical protein